MTLRGTSQQRLAIAAVVVFAGVAWSPMLSVPASASPPALQACTANNVKVTAERLGDVRGQRLEAFKLRNTGSSTCGMYGYPDLTFFTASRLDALVKVVHTTSVYASVVPKLLTIGPNEVVSFGLSYRGATTSTTTSPKKCLVESILIQIPLAPTSSGDFAYHQSFNACRAHDVVAVTPVEGRTLPRRSGAIKESD
jgi:hypothetical protein